MQVLEQPSLSKEFPSSQASDPIVYPSPHISEHVEAEVVVPPVHVHPKTFPEQSDLQPSVLSILPSSQVSLPITLPSPHIGVHVDALKPE